MNRFLCLTFSVVVSLLITQPASAETKLFRDFEYLTPVIQFNQSAGYTDCSGDFGTTARCQEKITFLEEPFEIALKFSGEQLQTVVLAADFNDKVYAKVFGALTQSFQLIAMRDKTNFFDILETRKQVADNRKFADLISKFEADALNQGKLSYFFIEEKPEALTKFKSALQAEREASLNARTVELIVVEDDDALLIIEFSLPRREIQRMQESMKNAKKEKF